MKNKLKLIKIGIICMEIACIAILVFGSVLFIMKKDDIKYQEKTNITYGVKLKDGTIYNDEEQFDFSSSDVEKITVNIEYFNSDEEIKDAEYTISAYTTTYVNSTVSEEVLAVLNSRNTIKNKEKIISNFTNVTFEIDYQAKITEVNQYIRSQKLEGKIGAAYEQLSLVSGEEQTVINISLLENKLSITEVDAIDNKVMESNMLSILLVVGSVVMLLVGGYLYYIVRKLSALSDYDLSSFGIFKFNKDILIEGDIQNEDMDNSTLVKSFEELVKVQNMVGLPIVYKKEENKCLFVIKAGTNKYSYVLEK